jgi:hypothetical protein
MPPIFNPDSAAISRNVTLVGINNCGQSLLTLADGQYKVPNLPFRIRGSEIGAQPDIPRSGEHMRGALLAAAMVDGAITALAREGAFGNKPV